MKLTASAFSYFPRMRSTFYVVPAWLVRPFGTGALCTVLSGETSAVTRQIWSPPHNRLNRQRNDGAVEANSQLFAQTHSSASHVKTSTTLITWAWWNILVAWEGLHAACNTRTLEHEHDDHSSTTLARLATAAAPRSLSPKDSPRPSGHLAAVL